MFVFGKLASNKVSFFCNKTKFISIRKFSDNSSTNSDKVLSELKNIKLMSYIIVANVGFINISLALDKFDKSNYKFF